MKRLRIIETHPAAPKRVVPLPEDVARLLPYTTDSYVPLTTPAMASRHPKRRVARWAAFGALALSSLATLGVVIAILATRPGTPPPPEPVPAPQLRIDGGNTLRCVSDELAVFVADERGGDRVLVGTVSGADSSLVFTLDRVAGGYRSDITVDGGAVSSASAVRGQPMTVWPDETLLLQVDGVAGARRLLVTGPTSFGSREREVCQ
jgi:hypothetical protein